jgi:hypothetical protein
MSFSSTEIVRCTVGKRISLTEWNVECLEDPTLTSARIPFQPIPEIILYEFSIRRSSFSNDEFSALNVLNSEALPWGPKVACVCFPAGTFQPGDTFEDFVKRNKGRLHKNPLGRIWAYWGKVRLAQKQYTVSQCDREFVDQVLEDRVNKMQYNAIAETFEPEKRGKLALRETIKFMMLREGRWIPTNLSVCTQWTTQATEEEIQEMQESKQVVIEDGKVYITPLKEGHYPLQKDEPVDFAIWSGQPWSIRVSPCEKITFSLLCQLRPGERLPRRAWLERDDYSAIQSLCQQLSATKVLFVFPEFCERKNFFETLTTKWIPTRLMINNRAAKPAVSSVVKQGGTFYQQELSSNKKQVKVSEVVLFNTHSSFQTCLLKDTHYIPSNWLSVVFLFSSHALPRRWLKWLDTKCGSETTLCVVGSMGLYY